MTLQLHVLSGARAGTRLEFEKPVVTVGRHAMSDLKFDPKADLDVSTNHGELRASGGGWIVVDQGSTNGTFVNGERVTNERRVYDGDVINFGANGPRVEVGGAGVAPPGAKTLRPEATPQSAAPGVKPRRDTTARVAEAVQEQTKGMKRGFAAAIGVLIAAGAMGFVYTQRQSSARERELEARFAHQESLFVAEQKKNAAARPSDTAFAAALQAELEAKRKELASMRASIAGGTGSVELLSKQQTDWSKVSEANDAAVAFVVSDLEGTNTAGTAFGITSSGLLVTNKHVVRAEGGQAPRRLVVLFANTKGFKPAHVVRISETDDLALIQIDVTGTYPVVSGVSRTAPLARVGAPIASIGFPLANDTPMEGSGLSDMIARTTMTPGTVSKRLDDVLQMDSFSTHGASGSPVFDRQGSVVGVIYGGARESNGKIVYAVPAQRLSAFLGADGAGIIR